VRHAADLVERGVARRWRRLWWRLSRPALALGGGGTRGFAHLGLLAVLEEEGLRPHAVVGTSMGAVVGAMVLGLGSVDAAVARWRQAFEQRLLPPVAPLRKLSEEHEHPLLQVARQIRNRVVVSMAMSRTTVLDRRPLLRALDFLLPDVDLRDLRPTFVVVATDLESGEEVRLETGPLRVAVAASCAIPGLLPAVEVDGRRLVDGGVVAEVPVSAARALRRPVVAVDASMELPTLDRGGLALDTMMRAQMMTARLLRERQLEGAAQILRPRVGAATWADWRQFDDMVAAGRAVARAWLGLPPG
jgi:NTE family protein